MDPNLSFSIIVGDRTLDVECKTKQEYDSWMSALVFLVRSSHLSHDSDPSKM